MNNNIETRKVQRTGGSSFIISLPKGWVVKSGIEKNDTLGIIAQPDGNLLITPKFEDKAVLKSKEINIEGNENPNFVFRLLIGTYIMGYSRIIVKSSRKMEPKVRSIIRKFIRIAIGPEILEESNNYVMMKDLLNPKEMPFEKTIKRMYILAENMHRDAINALKERKKNLAKEVVNRDNEVDRLHWLIGRQSHIVLRDIILSQKMGVTLESAHHYQQMSRLLERVGDHAVKIAENVLKVIDQKLDSNLLEKILKASEISMKALTNSMDAWMQNDITIANENIESISELVNLCEDINIDPGHIKVESYIAIGYIVESIRRTGEYAADICEIIINNLINSEE
ncbi:MAG: phosphate uptake regulator PhoU [Promethearchaeia archaeon]